MRRISKEMKEMQGTFEPSKSNNAEVSHEIVTKLWSPSEWPKELKEIYLDICEIIRTAGYLSKASYYTIRDAAFHEHRRRYAESKLLENPNELKWDKLLNEHSKQMRDCCTKLCLNPSDIYRAPQHKKEDGIDRSLIKVA